LVNDAVVENTGWLQFPAFYMMGACVIGLIALPFLQETKGCSIRTTVVTARTQLALASRASSICARRVASVSGPGTSVPRIE
ncbi:hypothetical protein PJM50_30395, partial [Mycobacterium kansasii]